MGEWPGRSGGFGRTADHGLEGSVRCKNVGRNVDHGLIGDQSFLTTEAGQEFGFREGAINVIAVGVHVGGHVAGVTDASCIEIELGS